MILELKDIIYILVYVVSVTGFIVSFKYRISKVAEDAKHRISKVAEDAKLAKRTLFRKDGTLNVLNQTACKEHREVIESDLKRESDTLKRAFRDIEFLNNNVIRIMIHLKIEGAEKISWNSKE